MLGLIHLYCGNGKGKTTSAMGLVLRQVALDHKIVIAQFLKDNTSGELQVLKTLPNVMVYEVKMPKRFIKQMNKAEFSEMLSNQNRLFQMAIANLMDTKLLILDEIIDAINANVILLTDLLAFLKSKPDGLEVVMTGRKPNQSIIDLCDYYTNFECKKHPYHNGILARKGIEY